MDTEYQLTGNQIKQYDEMKKSIEDLIKTKQLEILMEQAHAGYEEAVANRAAADDAYAENYRKVQEQKEKYDKAYNDWKEYEAEAEKARQEGTYAGWQHLFGALLTETVEVPEQVNDLGDMIPAHTEVHYIENPEYNPELQYVPRTERPEWAAVGMLGKLVVVDDGSCQINSFCSVGQNGVATTSENGYRVIARVDKNHIKIIFR